MDYRKEIKDTLKLAYPVMVGQLGLISMNVVDSLMVGKLGPAPLAASSVANNIFVLHFIISLGISFALTPLIAIAVGGKRLNECEPLFKNALLVNFIVGILLAIINYFASSIIYYLNQPAEIIEYAVSYSRLLGLSIVPMAVFLTYKQFVEGFSKTIPAMVLTIAANFLNFGVNYFVIYGNYGAPKLGLSGAAIGTFIARTFMAVGIYYYATNNKLFKGYDLKFRFNSISKSIIKKLLDLGIPSAFQYIFEVGAFSFAVIMVGWLGTKQLAAHQIALNLASISFMIITGISNASAIRVGNALGKGSSIEVRKSGFSAISLSALIMFFCGLIFIFFRYPLSELYLNDAEVIGYSTSILVIVALFQLSDGIQATGIGVLRGITDVKGPTVITFFSYWIVALPVGYLLGFILNFGIIGIWTGLLIGLTAAAILLTLRFNYKSKKI